MESAAAGNPDGVFNPATADDLMVSPASTTRWIAPYTYKKLMADYFAPQAPASATPPFQGNALTVQLSEPPWREHLMVCGVLDLDGKPGVELEPLWHTERRGDRRPVETSSDYTVVLVDRDGRALESRPIVDTRGRSISDSQDPHTFRNSGQLRFIVNLPLDDGATAMEIRNNDDVMARVDRPRSKPRVRGLDLRQGQRRWELRWEGAHAGKLPLTYSVWVSGNDGKAWQRLATDLKQPKLSFDPAKLAGGKRCRLRVLACDGFNTTARSTSRFTLPPRPPEVMVLNAQDGDRLPADRALLLEAIAVSPSEGCLPSESIRWSSNRQGPLGVGEQLWVQLEEGRHRITVRCEHSPDCVGEETIEVNAERP